MSKNTGYSPIVILLGLIGMIFSLVGNILEKQEMYPLFIKKENLNKKTGLSGILDTIPTSLFFSCTSDILVGIYGLIIGDPIIVIYGVVNTVVILCTLFELNREYYYYHLDNSV